MILDKFRLDNKVAIVTGAGKGIGACTALSLAEVGAQVVCVARTQSDVDAQVSAIEAIGAKACAVVADVTEAADRNKIINTSLERFGRIDVLVNNAGGTGHGPTSDITDEQVYETMQINFMAPVYLSRDCIPYMQHQGAGAIVNISSGMSRVANVGSIPYGAAKAAQEQATRMMAMEFSPEIRINSIRVGAIQTDNMQVNLLDRFPGVEKELSEWTPVGRIGQPEDIASAVVYLASEASSYMTGKVLDVDGGMIIERSLMELMSTAKKMYSR